jgi:hypothetical protein
MTPGGPIAPTSSVPDAVRAIGGRVPRAGWRWAASSAVLRVQQELLGSLFASVGEAHVFRTSRPSARTTAHSVGTTIVRDQNLRTRRRPASTCEIRYAVKPRSAPDDGADSRQQPVGHHRRSARLHDDTLSYATVGVIKELLGGITVGGGREAASLVSDGPQVEAVSTG